MENNKLLEGVKILDFTGVIAGSYCTKQLSDLGADVLKIEHPDGDIMRKVAPLIGEFSTVYAALNAGKRNLSLNLKKPAAVKICKSLCKEYDIVVENFKPGVMERLGLGYSDLRKVNKKIIMCSISGFGQKGPKSKTPAYAPIIQALSGFDKTYISNQENLKKPLNMGPPIGDTTASLQAYGSICAALYYREKKGIGQHIDIAMMDSLLSTMHKDIQNALLKSGTDRTYGPIRTADGHIILMPLSKKQFISLAKSIGQPNLVKDPRFVSDTLRLKNYDTLMHLVENYTKNIISEKVVKLFANADIPCATYRTLKEALEDSQTTSRKLLINSEHEGKQFSFLDAPVKFSETQSKKSKHTASVGQHTSEVLTEELRLAETEIKKLFDDNVIFSKSS